MLQIFDLILDFFRGDHSPRPTDKKMQNEQLLYVKEISAKNVVFLGSRAGRASVGKSRKRKGFSMLAELRRARPAVKILNIRARPAAAELGRAWPR